MVLLAFSLQDQIDKYGTYIGIAAFFGLAVLTLLYFAQAREVKRLREWAGRAPERAAELEMAVQEHAEEVRRTPVPAPQPMAAPVQTVPATNGVVKLQPAEVAALAFARSAGVHEPHEPKAHPVAAVVAPPTEAATATVEAEPPAPAVNGGGAGHPPVPKPATPAARRIEQPPPPPLPPRRVAAAAAGRRTTTAPPPRESNSRAVIITAVVCVLVLAGAVFGITRLAGGGDDPAQPENRVATPTPDAGGGEEDPATTATAQPSVTKETARIGIYNATGAPNLAATNEQLLLAEGYPDDNMGTGNVDQRQTSVVLYARGARQAADGVADVLGISSVKQLADDPVGPTLADDADPERNVVAIIGADKSN